MSLWTGFRALAAKALGFPIVKGMPGWSDDVVDKPQGLPVMALDFPAAIRRVVTVGACVRRYSSDMAKLPLLFERKVGDEWEPLEREPGNIVDVWHRANRMQAGIELRRDLYAGWKAFGNAYLVADRFGGVKVLDIWTASPHLVEVVPTNNPGRDERSFVFNRGGKCEEIPGSYVIHLRNYNPDDEPLGVSPLEGITFQYENRYDAMRLVQKVMRAGGVANGFFRPVPAKDGVNKVLDPVEKDAARKMLAKLFGGINNQGTPKILDVWEFVQTAMTPADQRLLETVFQSDADICRALGMPPWKLGIREGQKIGEAAKTTGAEEDYQYWNDNRTDAEFLDAVLTEKLVPMFGLKDIRVRTDFSGILVLQSPVINAAQQLTALCGRAPLTTNEVRVMLGKAPADDPEADELYTQPVASFGGLGGDPSSPDTPKPGESKPAAEEPVQKKRSMDDPIRLDRWKAKDALLSRSVNRFQRELASILDGIFARVVNAILDEGVRAYEAKRNIELDVLTLPDPEDEASILRLYQGLIRERMDEGIAEVAAMTGSALALELAYNNARVASFIRTRMELTRNAIQVDTYRAIRAQLADAVVHGESLSQMVARVEALQSELVASKSLTIARTEAVSGFNFATNEAYLQSDLVEAQEWLTARDNAVRDDHAAADGQVARLGEYFDIGGTAMLYPGDPAGGPEQCCNCRCVCLPVLKEEARMRAWARYFPSQNGHASRLAGLLS